MPGATIFGITGCAAGAGAGFSPTSGARADATFAPGPSSAVRVPAASLMGGSSAGASGSERGQKNQPHSAATHTPTATFVPVPTTTPPEILASGTSAASHWRPRSRSSFTRSCASARSRRVRTVEALVPLARAISSALQPSKKRCSTVVR